MSLVSLIIRLTDLILQVKKIRESCKEILRRYEDTRYLALTMERLNWSLRVCNFITSFSFSLAVQNVPVKDLVVLVLNAP